jgi:beta-N-acetylhexosaminidase
LIDTGRRRPARPSIGANNVRFFSFVSHGAAPVRRDRRCRGTNVGLAVLLRIAILALLVAAVAAPSASDAKARGFIAPKAFRTHSAVYPTPKKTPNASGQPSLESMIGQMILIGFAGTRPQQASPARITNLIRDGRIGGVVLYDYNIVGPSQLMALDAAFNAAGGKIRPFLCVDQEGGAVQRLTRAKGFAGLPAAARISSFGRAKAYQLDLKAAQELAGLGINVNFGPVVDLDINPADPVIGRPGRSFGADPETVITYAEEFIRAHAEAGVLTAAKHFPGHGSAIADPHRRAVDISKTWRPSELVPYRRLIGGRSVEMVMVGHVIAPDFSDDGDVPASLSRRTIQDQLRGKLHFNGLVVTDDLEMAAIRSRYSIEQAAVMAIAAGADLLIVNDRDPAVADRIVAAVAGAVRDGKIERGQIETAYRMIVHRKLSLATPPHHATPQRRG